MKKIKLGVIGYGFRTQHLLGVMRQVSDDIDVVGICDVDLEKARKQAQTKEPDFKDIKFSTSADEFFETSKLDAVIIGTNCYTHASLAVKVMERNLPLFLEKPVAINVDQLETLKEIARKKKHKVVVSFPLRMTPLLQEVKKIVDTGQIGNIEHIQAINNVAYGHCY